MIYENIILKKKRINSKKWEHADRFYTLELEEFEETPKLKRVVYCWLNTNDASAVRALNQDVSFIVMTPLGANMPVKTLDFQEVKEAADKVTQRCSVTGKRIVIVHPQQLAA